MDSRTALSLAFAAALVAVPLAGMSQTITQAVPIVGNGTCPKAISVTVVTKQYPGGFTMDYTAQTTAVAKSVSVAAATPRRIAFTGMLNPVYHSCVGSGKAGDVTFALTSGSLRYSITPGKGPNGTYPGALHVNVVKGLPHANMSITD